MMAISQKGHFKKISTPKKSVYFHQKWLPMRVLILSELPNVTKKSKYLQCIKSKTPLRSQY